MKTKKLNRLSLTSILFLLVTLVICIIITNNNKQIENQLNKPSKFNTPEKLAIITSIKDNIATVETTWPGEGKIYNFETSLSELEIYKDEEIAKEFNKAGRVSVIIQNEKIIDYAKKENGITSFQGYNKQFLNNYYMPYLSGSELAVW